MYFALAADGTTAHGRWVAQGAGGEVTGGHAALARTREDAATVIAGLTG
jgi:hypothetical protein